MQEGKSWWTDQRGDLRRMGQAARLRAVISDVSGADVLREIRKGLFGGGGGGRVPAAGGIAVVVSTGLWNGVAAVGRIRVFVKRQAGSCAGTRSQPDPPVVTDRGKNERFFRMRQVSPPFLPASSSRPPAQHSHQGSSQHGKASKRTKKRAVQLRKASAAKYP